MKYHILLKFLAIVLCACALAGCIGSVLGIVVLAEHGLYEDVTPEQLYNEQLEFEISTYARFLTIRYAGKNLGGCPDELLENFLNNNFSYSVLDAQDSWYYTICDASGKVLDSRYDAAVTADAWLFTYDYAPRYPTVISYSQDGVDGEYAPGSTIPTVPDDFIPGTARPAPEGTDYLHVESYFFRDSQGVRHQYEVGLLRGPEYTVTLYLQPNVLALEDDWVWQLLFLGYEYRYARSQYS